MFCYLEEKYGNQVRTRCTGCGVPPRTEKIRYLFSLYTTLKIHVEWDSMKDDYQDLTIEPHRTAIEMRKIDQER